jgi:hypothetical protein
MRRYPVLNHLLTMTDDVGIIQHATYDVPNRASGYCTDDIARAFMVALAAGRNRRLHEVASGLAERYLAFLYDAQLPDGRLHNFMGYDRRWLDIVGSQDSFGRAMWSAGYGMRHAPRDSWRRVSGLIFERAFQVLSTIESLRSRAYAILGMVHAYEARARDDLILAHAIGCETEALAQAYEQNSDAQWRWFEGALTYDNARLPEAMIRAGALLEEERFVRIGLEALQFYESVTLEDGIFVPIGNQGWHPRGGARARFGQQPLEAVAMVDAALAAADISRDPHYYSLAEVAHEWYLGRNCFGANLVEGGGCRDGIDDHGVSTNMGAESTLAYLSSAIALAEGRAEALRIAR